MTEKILARLSSAWDTELPLKQNHSYMESLNLDFRSGNLFDNLLISYLVTFSIS